MDFSWQYILSAALGGLAGGLGHALMSPSWGFGNTNAGGAKDFSGFRDIAVGLFSGLVWLLPNQNTWVDKTPKSTSELVLIALQTLIIGLAGSGWLTSHLDTNALKGAVAKAALAQPNPGVAGQISQAKSVSQVVGLAQTL